MLSVTGVTSPFYQLLTNNATDDYNSGYSDGYVDGVAKGTTNGILEGYNEGYFDGVAQGTTNGRLDVFNRGSAYYGFIDSASFDYQKGFSYGETGLVDQALIDVFQNGIGTKINPGDGDYFETEDSFDYIAGMTEGSDGAYERLHSRWQ